MVDEFSLNMPLELEGDEPPQWKVSPPPVLFDCPARDCEVVRVGVELSVLPWACEGSVNDFTPNLVGRPKPPCCCNIFCSPLLISARCSGGVPVGGLNRILANIFMMWVGKFILGFII